MTAVFTLAPLLVGCYATKVVRAPSVSPEAAVPALMVSTIVETQVSNQDEGLIGTAVALADNDELATFGERVEPAVRDWLTSQGVEQGADKDRLMAGRGTDWARVANDFTVFSGTWVDPDGLGVRLATDTLFAGGTLRAMGAQLGGADGREIFTYTTVTVVPLHEWIVLGVPRVRLSVIAHDREGNEVLRAQAWGVGRRTAFIVDRSPTSLQKGFDEALAKLAAAQALGDP